MTRGASFQLAVLRHLALRYLLNFMQFAVESGGRMPDDDPYGTRSGTALTGDSN
jgi:hypothetical protein